MDARATVSSYIVGLLEELCAVSFYQLKKVLYEPQASWLQTVEKWTQVIGIVFCVYVE